LSDREPTAPAATPGRSRVAAWLLNLGSGYADFAVGGLIYLVLTPIIVSRLGVEAFAVWIVSHTITFYLHFLDLGLTNAQVRFHARFTGQGRQRAFAKLISTVAVALTVAGIAAFVLGVVVALGLPMPWFEIPATLEEDFRIVLLILAAKCLVSLPGSTIDNLYEGVQRFDLRNWIAIGLRTVTALGQWLLLEQGYGIVALAALELGLSCVQLLIGIIVIRRLIPGLMQIRVRFHRRTWRRIRAFSMWTLFDDLLTEGTQKFDAFVIALLLPIGVLAPYALSQTIASIVTAAVDPISETYLPIAADLHGRRRLPELARLLVLGTKLVTAVAAPIAIVLIFFGHFLLGAWIPELKAETPPALIGILSVDILVSVYLVSSAVVLLAMERVRTIAILTLAEVAVSLTGILLLTPHFGIVGVAAGMLIANVLLGLAVQIPIVARDLQTTGWRFAARTLLPLLLAMLPAVVVAAVLRETLGDLSLAKVAAASLATGTTCVAGFVLFGLTRAEWRETLRAGQPLVRRLPAALQRPLARFAAAAS
jgi:O-antigen/teichoic acid export membrane protein